MENKGEKTGRRRGPPVVGRKRKFRSLRKILEGTAGRRKWAELQTDCLINVFKRIGMESLVLSVPFVCKSWHEATLDPLCWQNLSFPDFLPLLEPPKRCTSLGALDPFYYKFVDKCRVKNTTSFSITAFVRMVVGRSHGKAVEIKLPGFIDEETLRYVSDSCPGIRVLCLPDDLVLFKHSRVVSELIGKWKLLEQLLLGGNLKQIHTFRADLDNQRMNELFAMGDVWLCETIMDDILKQIGIHCKHFVGLGIAHAYKLNASNIVESLPNLKYLWFEESHLEMKSLHTLVKGCKQLEVLDVGKSHVDSIIGGLGVFIADRAKAYGVEFLWKRSGDEDGEDYYSLDAQMLARKLLLNRARGPRMSTAGMAPRSDSSAENSFNQEEPRMSPSHCVAQTVIYPPGRTTTIEKGISLPLPSLDDADFRSIIYITYVPGGNAYVIEVAVLHFPGICKPSAAPIECVQRLIQNQDDMIKRIGECFSITIKEDKFDSLWRGHTANI